MQICSPSGVGHSRSIISRMPAPGQLGSQLRRVRKTGCRRWSVSGLFPGHLWGAPRVALRHAAEGSGRLHGFGVW